MTERKRCLTGIRATGQIHIGNYLGAIRPALARQADYECFFFVADLHAAIDQHDGSALAKSAREVAATWLALGLDTSKHHLWRQSDAPEVCELAWYLSCVTGLGLLEKGHAVKDARDKGKDVSHALLSYPALMAADILLYDANIVPVGKDQKQHVEFARDMAGSLHARYGEGLLTVPEILLDESVMVIPGLDGQKMSKSYNNTIPLFAPTAELKKKVMSLKTDSAPLEDPKALDGSALGELFRHFAAAEEYNSLKERLARGGMGWGHAKEELATAIERFVAEPRRRYEELLRDTDSLDRELTQGASRVREIGHTVLNRVRKVVGMRIG